MEKFQEHQEKAAKNIKIANHMLGVTFLLVKDPKLLLAIIENIFLAYTNTIAAVLHYERLFKRIPPFQDTFESKLNMFREKIIPKHNMDKSYLIEVQDIRDIIIDHKKSPVEFKRGNKLVICTENYRMKTISERDIQKYLDKAKVFIELTNHILEKDAGIFRST